MEPISQFGWPEVAAIAGVTIVCLLTLLGALLGIILKRQNSRNNGFLGQVKMLQSSIESKIEQEREDRKEDFAQLRNSIEQGKREQRTDIGELHRKLEAVFLRVTSEFKAMCNHRQALCVEMQKSEMKRSEDKIGTACRRIEKLEQNKVSRWEKQERLNLDAGKKSKA